MQVSDSAYSTAFADLGLIRKNAGNTVGIGSITDIDKVGQVTFCDINAMRNNVGTQLTNITIGQLA